MKSFRELEVWQRSLELSVAIYRLTQQFPKHEIYGVCSQMQRAAVSIAANIAEGHARESTKEFLHHLSYSLGSLAELETFLAIVIRLDYCKSNQAEPLHQLCDEIGRMLRGLQKALRKRLNDT